MYKHENCKMVDKQMHIQITTLLGNDNNLCINILM